MTEHSLGRLCLSLGLLQEPPRRRHVTFTHTLKELIDGRVSVLRDSATGAQPLHGAHGDGAVGEKPSVYNPTKMTPIIPQHNNTYTIQYNRIGTRKIYIYNKLNNTIQLTT